MIEFLSGKREQDAPDARGSLFEGDGVSPAEVPTVLPPVVLEPRSGGEVWFGRKVSPEYPDEFSPGEFLLVQIAEIQR